MAKKVEKSEHFRFPQGNDKWISYAYDGDFDYDDGEADHIVAPPVDPTPKPKEGKGSEICEGEDCPVDCEGEDCPDEAGGLNNALLGTATGIIILAIIIVLIWFIRKKHQNRDQSHGNESADYKAGTAELQAQQA